MNFIKDILAYFLLVPIVILSTVIPLGFAVILTAFVAVLLGFLMALLTIGYFSSYL